MSSTYFRNVECFKKEDADHCNQYVMVVETAESNVRDFDNKLCWHKWIYTSGSYYELMRTVCASSYEFEDGCSQWKPTNKTPEGFIHTCRKAIKEAKEGNLLYSLTAVVAEKSDEEMCKIFNALKNIEGVSAKEDDFSISLFAKDVELICNLQMFVKLCKNNYKDMKPFDFAKWFCNEHHYNFRYEPIIEQFKEVA